MTKKLAVCLTTLAMLCTATAAMAGDDAAIIKAVDHAYVHGVHIDQDTTKIRDGFHESFIMFMKSDEGVKHMTRDEWIERIDASKAEADQKPRPKTKADISVIGHSGNAAVVKVELYRNGEHTFTDFISLYKFEDGWKLVGKIYYRH